MLVDLRYWSIAFRPLQPALAGGFVVFLAVQYGLLFGTGQMLGWFMNHALRTIIAPSIGATGECNDVIGSSGLMARS